MPYENKVVVAVYDTHVKAEQAILDLHKSGFDMKQVSIAGKDPHADEHAVGFWHLGDTIKQWSEAGVFWGNMWGMLLGAAVFAFPGVGAIMIGGPLVAWMAARLEGTIVLGGLTAIGAALFSVGVPEESVAHYETALKTNKFLVLTHGTSEEIAVAHELIKGTNPSHVGLHELRETEVRR